MGYFLSSSKNVLKGIMAMKNQSKITNSKVSQLSFKESWKRDFRKNWVLYLMILPIIAFYLIFHYKPMYGALMAFQDFSPKLGVMGSPWVGFKWFEQFFSSSDFPRLMKNTLSISLTSLICGFPLPIIFALFLNEIKNNAFKRTVQTISYLPHFISLVVICGMIKSFVASDGIVGMFYSMLTGDNISLLNNPKAFVPIYVISGIWQSVGWSSILYLSALSTIDQQQYEAAEIDGAGRFRKMWHITLPGLRETMVVLLILNMGSIMNVGHDKVLLLYHPGIYSTADIISTYVYRLGFETRNWSMSTAVGLFNSVCTILLVLISNRISKRVSGSGVL